MIRPTQIRSLFLIVRTQRQAWFGTNAFLVRFSHQGPDMQVLPAAHKLGLEDQLIRDGLVKRRSFRGFASGPLLDALLGGSDELW